MLGPALLPFGSRENKIQRIGKMSNCYDLLCIANDKRTSASADPYQNP